MSENSYRDSLFSAFLYDTYQLLDSVENEMIACEEREAFSHSSINEIFRAMHTIKGSAAMMEFNNISSLAHALEDMFFYIRENKLQSLDFHALSDIVLKVLDFIKSELAKAENGGTSDGNEEEIRAYILSSLKELKSAHKNGVEENEPASTNTTGCVEVQDSPGCPDIRIEKVSSFHIKVKFIEDCQMENLRAFLFLTRLKEVGEVHSSNPEDLNSPDSEEIIKLNGFEVIFSGPQNREEIEEIISNTVAFLQEIHISPAMSMPCPAEKVENPRVNKQEERREIPRVDGEPQEKSKAKSKYISVDVEKLDKLMDVVGELVISEVLVTRNPEITKLKLKSFIKAAGQLRKMTSELQDIVMSIRMVPISQTFRNMNRIIRDMSRNLNKNVELVILGEETEMDKNVIEAISDPLLHLVRNSIDHGIETPEDRLKNGKTEKGRITLEAKHEGGYVWVSVTDNGKGLHRDSIIKKAWESGLVNEKDVNELSDDEVYQLILKPGFSTKAEVSEYSGRGVGMDVVVKNIEKIGGKLYIKSTQGVGTTFKFKIPLTLAIMNGMQIAVGHSNYTISTTNIKEAFRPDIKDVFTDSGGNEVIMLRGNCYQVIRLHRTFQVENAVTSLAQGILIVAETESNTVCLFADRLIGEHQVVVKPVPSYIKKIDGVSGCTILGDGSISLILDIAGLMNR